MQNKCVRSWAVARSILWLAFFYSLAAGVGSIEANAADGYVYFDSVPRGAEVLLVPLVEGAAAKDEPLGVTPLRVESKRVSGRKVVVMMHMSELVRQMKGMPELKQRSDELLLGEEFGTSGMDHTFVFDVATSREIHSAGGGLVAAGPYYEIKYPEQNRYCGWFVPRGVGVRTFFGLMPPAGTFSVSSAGFAENLKRQYRFSQSQADEAVESLSRSGKYQTVVLSRTVSDSGERISITATGEPAHYTFIVERTVGKLYKGLDY